jgi:hypothetical protein
MEKPPPRVSIKFSLEVYPDRRRPRRSPVWIALCSFVLLAGRKLGAWLLHRLDRQ